MNYINPGNIAILLIFMGVYGFITKRNMIKSVMSLSIIQTAIVLYFLSVGDKKGGSAPIVDSTDKIIVDPLPQALMITAIIIGVGVTALSLAIIIRLYHIYGTLSWEKIFKRRIM